jgi:AMMECR1 domain-containing protein
VAQRAHEEVLALISGREDEIRPALDAIPEKLDSIYLTVYIDGRLRGCMGAVVRDLDADIKQLARAALADERFACDADADANTPAHVAVTVSFLFAPLVLGYFSPEEVVTRVRHGEQTLMAYQGERVGLLLPFVASTDNLDRADFARAVLRKAGIDEEPYNWCRFDCVTWLADADGARVLVGGFPASDPPDASPEDLLNRLATLHCRYLLRHAKDDGTLYQRYEPCRNRLYEGIDAPRLAHAAWVLARAGNALRRADLSAAAGKIIDRLLGMISTDDAGHWVEPGDGYAPSVAEVSFLLLALLELPPEDPRRRVVEDLTATLRSCIDRHGRVVTHRPPAESPEAYQDYFPGQVLLALTSSAAGECAPEDEERLRRAFRYYRHRFRHARHFGQVSWLMQAFARRWYATQDPWLAEFVFEIGDWILGYQQEKTGGFINDHQPDAPGYTTALYLEGIAAALKIAVARADDRLRDRYLESIARGFRFLDRLVIQQRDACVLPNPDFAVGGLRQSIQRSEVRVDFVQHSLSAILELHPLSASFGTVE